MAARIARRSVALAAALLLVLGVLLAIAPRLALATEGDLVLSGSTPQVYVTSGGERYFELKVTNTTSSAIEGVMIVDHTVYTDPDGYRWRPYLLQDKGCPNPVNATADEGGYTIAANTTATFYVNAISYDRAVGTYNDFIQLGKGYYEYYQEYDPTDGGYWISRRFIVEDTYSSHITVKMHVYNPTDAALTVGTSTDTGATVTPLGSTGVDFGTINLSSGNLNSSKAIYIKNTSPTVDTHTGSRPSITVKVGFENTSYDWFGDTPYHLLNTMGQSWVYGGSTTVGPDAWLRYDVSLDASEYIAGTYTALITLDTVPYGISVNGGAISTSGEYAIPVTVKLTGTNNNLPKRATNLTATPGNGQVELTWNAAMSVDDPDEYVRSYSVWRRVGTDTTNPDNLDWTQYEGIGTAVTQSDGTCLFVDGFAENNTTYTYTVIADNPYKSYAATLASATPKSSYNSRLMAPEDFYVGEELGGVTLEWEMPEAYGGTSNDGSAQVDHFNVYRDGRLVAQVQQSAVKDDMRQAGWDDDGPVFSHEYGWEVFLETPQTGIDYVWNVAAVSKSGVEGYWTEGNGQCPGYPASAVSEELRIVSHSANYFRYGYDDEGNEVPTISVSLDVLSYGDMTETMTIWRSVGTSAPDTNGTPYATEGTPGTYGGKAFGDTNITEGATYTYTVQVTDAHDAKSNFYTFTVKAAASDGEDQQDYSTADVTWWVTGAPGTTANMEFRTEAGSTYKVYRNNVQVQTYTGNGSYVTYTNNPGSDGAYTYRVDRVANGVTVRGRDYTFQRDTSPVDESQFLTVPDAPTLSVRTSNGYPVLAWNPAPTGSAVDGYHIYRSDAGRTVASYRKHQETPWYPVVDKYWGKDRYLTIADADTHEFVDGATSYYHDDEWLGVLENVAWYEDECPHTYWITSYNEAGESAPSQVVTLNYTGEDGVAPANNDEDAPVAPVITRLWVEWDDESQNSDEWDDYVGGRLRVAFEQPVSPGVEHWSATFDDGAGNTSTTIPLYYYQTVDNDGVFQGVGSSSLSEYVDGFPATNYGDVGKTYAVTVTAANDVGSAVSQAATLTIASPPRIRALAGDNAVHVEWTGLFEDTTTQVSGWEVWREGDYEPAAKVATLGASTYSYLDESAENGFTYKYWVRAVTDDGLDHVSAVRTLTPSASATFEAPGAPTNFRAWVSNGSIVFSWDPPTTGGTPKYYVVQELFGQEWAWTGDHSAIDVPSTGSVMTQCEAGTHKFRVVAVNRFNSEETAAPSNVATLNVTEAQANALAPDEPTVSITATGGEASALLAWSATGDPASFELFCYEWATDDLVGDIFLPGDARSFTWENLDPGTRYYFEIVAMNNQGTYHASAVAVPTGTSHDEKVAAKVEALIRALPEPADVALDDADAIGYVQGVWEDLTPRQQALVDPTLATKLADDVAALEELALLEQYTEIVEPVQALIDALPAGVDVVAADAFQIQAARTAYNALSPAEAKRLVKTAKLVDAENGLAAVPAKEAIAALPNTSSLTLNDKADVQAARAAYDALTSAQKECVGSTLVAKLAQAEARIAQLQKQADDEAASAPVIAAIDALPAPANLSLSNSSAVSDARAAYDALTDDQKALVGQERAGKLAACEARLVELLEQLSQLEDEEAAAGVDALIDAIGEVTLESESKIATARNAYESVSDGAKAKVTKLSVLEAAEARLAQLKAEAQEAADRAAAQAVADQIAALPAASAVTPNDAGAVSAARAALDNLTASQRAYVPQASIDKLVACEQALSKRTITRIAGDYANETSALISREAFTSSDWVVLARDDDFADALGATGVAGVLDCPIILTDRMALSDAAADEISRLGAKNCYIIGGTGAMKTQLETDLKGVGVTFVDRLWGDNSYDTSLACARKVVELGGKPDEAIIAMSTNFQDALSMSSYAYKYKVPVILQTWGTYASDRGFTPEAQQWLQGKKLVVAGGAGAISNESVSPYTVTVRLWGDSGYDTSQAIAEWMVGNGFLSPDSIVIACGAQLPKGTDALAGAALGGKLGAPMLLATTNTAMEEANTTTIDGFLAANAGHVRNAYVLGGAYVMPEALYNRIKSVIGA